MIDPHVHLRDWKQSSKETILHGMSVAAAASFTDLFDMPNTDPACTSRRVILDRLAAGSEAEERTGVSYHLYAGLTSDPDEIKAMVDLHSELFPLVIGLKLFAGQSTGNMGIIGPDNQRKVFRALSESGYSGVLAIHAEKEELLRKELYVPGRFETHSEARPAEAETESVRDIASIAAETGFKGTLHICHVSSASTIELVRELRKSGMRITMGATPHHALLSVTDAKEHDRYLKMNPPLRSSADRDAVFKALVDGTIDWAESDHAPHTIEDKEKGASGIPGLPGMLLLADRLRKAGCGEDRLSAIFGTRVSEVFGLDREPVSVPSNPYGIYERIRGEYPFDPFRS